MISCGFHPYYFLYAGTGWVLGAAPRACYPVFRGGPWYDHVANHREADAVSAPERFLQALVLVRRGDGDAVPERAGGQDGRLTSRGCIPLRWAAVGIEGSGDRSHTVVLEVCPSRTSCGLCMSFQTLGSSCAAVMPALHRGVSGNLLRWCASSASC